MTFRRIVGVLLVAAGVAFCALTTFVVAGNSTILLDDTSNTGFALGFMVLLLGLLVALPPHGARAGRFSAFRPALFLILFVAAPLAGGMLSSQMFGQGSTGAAVGAIIGHAIICVVFLIVARQSGVRAEQIAGPVPRGIGTWGLALLAIPLLMISWGELFLLLNVSALLSPAATGAQLGDVVASESTRQMMRTMLGLLAVAVTGPVTEELVFRGALQQYWAERRTASAGIVISSAVFALIHLEFFTALSTFVLGVAAGIVYARTKALILPVLIHGLHNLGSAVLIAFSGAEPTTNEQVYQRAVLGVFLFAVGVLWLALVLWSHTHYLQATPRSNTQPEQM